LISKLLINRGITDPDQAYRFLHPQLDDLHDPYLMKGMKAAVKRLGSALQAGEGVFIYGDYDVDGITSIAVLRRALEMLGGKVGYHIPDRLGEGYGLKKEIVEDAYSDGYRLVVSVDCGIRDFDVCEYARERGVDLIVTDHHLPDSELPPAFAILNPRQPECTYPEKNLAAVGVVLKLVQALFAGTERSGVVPHFLKMVAIGTVADMVPLTGENRVIAKFGLSGLSDARNVGLKALLEGAGVGQDVDQFDVGFKLAPRINAFTRMGGGKEIVDLFALTDPSQAEATVRDMNAKNIQRRQEENRILSEIETWSEEAPREFQSSFVLVAGLDWHKGVIGNVASRVAERFYRPVLVVSLLDGQGQGSGRSIPDFHLLKALDHCKGFFQKHGGHAQAVGCTLREEFCNPKGIDALRARLKDYADSILDTATLTPILTIDSNVPIDQISLDFYSELSRLAPYGIGNPVPVFRSRGARVVGGPWILKDRHLKLRVAGKSEPLDVIWWRNGAAAQDVESGSSIDVVYQLAKDVYRGKEKLVLTVKDLKTASTDAFESPGGNR
jgi:single-stranded-DNA-specific exonuclease